MLDFILKFVVHDIPKGLLGFFISLFVGNHKGNVEEEKNNGYVVLKSNIHRTAAWEIGWWWNAACPHPCTTVLEFENNLWGLGRTRNRVGTEFSLAYVAWQAGTTTLFLLCS
jgi:hypothetical protein